MKLLAKLEQNIGHALLLRFANIPGTFPTRSLVPWAQLQCGKEACYEGRSGGTDTKSFVQFQDPI